MVIPVLSVECPDVACTYTITRRNLLFTAQLPCLVISICTSKGTTAQTYSKKGHGRIDLHLAVHAASSSCLPVRKASILSNPRDHTRGSQSTNTTHHPTDRRVVTLPGRCGDKCCRAKAEELHRRKMSQVCSHELGSVSSLSHDPLVYGTALIPPRCKSTMCA